MSIPQRILLHVAIGAGLVIALATAVTYGIVYNAAKQSGLRHLATYVSERARREETAFRQVEANLRLVRGQFLKRMEAPIPADYMQKWNERFRLYPDGAWRSREQFADGRKWSTLWAHKDCRLTPEWQTQILRAQDICDELLRGWVDVFPSVYFVLPGWANIGFDPRLPTWVWDTPGDYNPSELEWFQLAMPKVRRTHAFAWTGVIEEPTLKVPIVSAYLPVEQDGRFVASIGHDIFVNRMMEETTRSGLAGAMHVIFRRDGRLIAHPAKGKEILASKGQLRMQESEDALARMYHAVTARTETQVSGYDRDSGLHYCVARLAGPDWFFLTTMPSDLLRREAFQSAQWVLWSGVLSLGVLLALLARTLHRQVAQPLAELTRATEQMSAGDGSARAIVRREDEIGVLTRSFNEMAQRVASRDAELRHLNQDLEQRVELRTEELTEANRRLDEGRLEALRLLARERELRELKSDFVSLVSHEFRTPLEIIMSSVDNLQRYRDRLAPEKREQLLHTINRSVRRMAGMMEEALVLGRVESGKMAFTPMPFDLHAFCRRLTEEIEAATNRRCPIEVRLDGAPANACGDENVLGHILSNLLSNAVKYSSEHSPVSLTVAREGDDALFQVIDRGCGIPSTDQQRIFQAFHRGANVRQIPGTGLGLVIVKRCVDLHHGAIKVQTAEGQGTTFTVRMPLFTQPPPANP